MYRGIGVLVVILLAGCVQNPLKSYADEIAKAKASGEPIYIYSRPDDSSLGFVNTSGHPISLVQLTLVICSVKGEESSEGSHPYWVQEFFIGPYAPGKVYLEKDPEERIVDKNGHQVIGYLGVYYRTKIVKTDIRYADAKLDQQVTDVAPILAGRISNFCPKHFIP